MTLSFVHIACVVLVLVISTSAQELDVAQGNCVASDGICQSLDGPIPASDPPTSTAPDVRVNAAGGSSVDLQKLSQGFDRLEAQLVQARRDILDLQAAWRDQEAVVKALQAAMLPSQVLPLPTLPCCSASLLTLSAAKHHRSHCPSS